MSSTEPTPGTQILTAIGKSKYRDALTNGGQVQITTVALGNGDGSLYDPTDTMTALKGEFARQPISSQRAVGDDATLTSTTFPKSIPFDHVRETGFFDQDGDLIFLWAGLDFPDYAVGGAEHETLHTLIFGAFEGDVITVEAPLEGEELVSLINDTGGVNADTLGGKSANEFATPDQITAAITALTDGAPGALDTFKELAAALANDPQSLASVLNRLNDLEDKTTAAKILDALKQNYGPDFDLDATTLGGKAAADFAPQTAMRVATQSDFAHGTLVKTDVDFASDGTAAVRLEVQGKGYRDTPFPFNFIVEAYVHQDTFFQSSGVDYSGNPNMPPITLLNLGGKIAIWWPAITYWQSFHMKIVRTAPGADDVNLITEVQDVPLPENAANTTNVILAKVWNDQNDTALKDEIIAAAAGTAGDVGSVMAVAVNVTDDIRAGGLTLGQHLPGSILTPTYLAVNAGAGHSRLWTATPLTGTWEVLGECPFSNTIGINILAKRTL